ncbi:hypothetical protein R6Q59_016390 [Mikania micrantha]
MKINTGGEVGYEIDLMSPPSSEFINRSNSTSAMAVTKEGIRTFRDDEEINRGEQVKPEIMKAISESRASIVVLSENYATSTWCLDELLFILDQRRERNHFVLPVFYHVNPADLRKQKGKFAVNIDRWKRALMKVADLSGLVLSGYGSDPITIDVNIS